MWRSIRQLGINYILMKKYRINSGILGLPILFICCMNLNAQVQVTRGSTHHYSVTPLPGAATYHYHWSCSGGTNSVFGNSATTNDIVWDGTAGLYLITVYPVKLVSDCEGNNQTLSVELVDMNILFAETSSIQCPKTDNETGDFSITVYYTGVSGIWSFSYSINGGLDQNVNVTSGNSSTISIPGFTNASSTNSETHTIRITSVTTADNYTRVYTGTETDASLRLYSVTVEPTPATSEIIQL
jgi:hypothetical protein